jgi:hypothetical protein
MWQVRVTHREGRVYAVQGLSSQPANGLRFMNDEVGAEQTIATYFRERYVQKICQIGNRERCVHVV